LVTGTSAGDNKETAMSLTDLCIVLGVLFAFATLILKVVEVARGK
jgi:hypothetical protein